MSFVSELDIISYLSNPKIRQKIKRRAIKYTPASPLNAILKEFYLSLPAGYLPEDGTLAAYLHQKNCTQEEISLALLKKHMYAEISKEGIHGPIDNFYFHFKSQKHKEALEIYNENRIESPDQALSDYISEVARLDSIMGTSVELINLAERDRTQTEEDTDALLIPSKFKLIQEASAYGAYCKGWLVVVTAPSGVGKSQYMINEAVNMALQGKKIVYFALGDIYEETFEGRIACIMNGVPQKEFVKNKNHYLTAEVDDVLNNIRLIAEPPGSLSSSEIVSIVNDIDPYEFNWDVLMVDYDGNIAAETDNLYMDGGNTYQDMLRIAQRKGDKKLVFVASQTKQEFWDTEILTKRCVSDSSKKQHNVDLMIGINCNPKNRRIGTMAVLKNRNGEELSTKYVYQAHGEFVGISVETYRDLLSNRDTAPQPIQGDRFA